MNQGITNNLQRGMASYDFLLNLELLSISELNKLGTISSTSQLMTNYSTQFIM